MFPKEFKAYLKEIELATPLIDRVEKIYLECTQLGLGVDKNIFVAETIDGEGKRTYQNLWFFGDEDAIEIKNFIGQDDYDQVKIKKQVVYWALRKKEFEIGKPATEKSRASVSFNLKESVSGDFRASKANCEKLVEILTTYFIPNLA